MERPRLDSSAPVLGCAWWGVWEHREVTSEIFLCKSSAVGMSSARSLARVMCERRAAGLHGDSCWD